jgi:UDPglucose 6-dehydrogenase
VSNIAVIGGGYVGLTTAAGFAELGHDVVVVEVDEHRRLRIGHGQAPFFEPDLDELLARGLSANRLSVVAPDQATYRGVEFVFLCLPTPRRADGSADLSYLWNAVLQCRQKLQPGTVVISKSTVPVGTARRLNDLLGRRDISVVANPEFLQEGAAVKAFMCAERVVIGADDETIAAKVADLYRDIPARVVSVGLESAELSKHACNAFLATKLSFVNSIAAFCELTEARIEEVTDVMGSDPRIGSQFLRAGPGWGGSCFPKDSASLLHDATQRGFHFKLLEAAMAANEDTIARVVDLVRAAARGVEGLHVAAWGLAFKAGTADTRESPAIAVLRRLLAEGARVVAYDPLVRAVEGIETTSSLYRACIGAQVLLVLTEWPEFGEADLAEVARIAPTLVVIDTRSVIDERNAADANLEMWKIGRAHLAKPSSSDGDTLPTSRRNMHADSRFV